MSVKAKPSTARQALSSNSSETMQRTLHSDVVRGAEGAAVGHGCNADSSGEVLSQVGRGAEPRQRRDPLDRLVARLQQVLRAPDALHQQPLQRRRAEPRLEPAYESAGADMGLASHVLQREWFAEPAHRPVEQPSQT